MGYDAYAYVVYGIPFPYKKHKDVEWLFELLWPDEDPGWEWANISDQVGREQMLLDFDNDKILFLCSWVSKHTVTRVKEPIKKLNLPAYDEQIKFGR